MKDNNAPARKQAAINQKWESMTSNHGAQAKLSFCKTVFSWRGSIYASTWKSMLIWLVLWSLIEGLWHATKWNGILQIVRLVGDHRDKIHMITTFVLAFYVNALYSRWWNLYSAIPWPDDLAMLVHVAFPNPDQIDIKRKLTNYVLVSQALAFAWLSPKFNHKYPTLNNLVEIGLLTFDEKIKLKRCMVSKYNECSYWTPYVWFQILIKQQYEQKEIQSELLFNHILSTSESFIHGLGSLLVTSDLSVPLAYVQVVTLLVWMVWFCGLFVCHSCSEPPLSNFPLPIFPFFISWVLLGWLEGSHALLFPFVSKTEGFDLVSLFERNMRIVRIMIETPLTEEYIENEAENSDFQSSDTVRLGNKSFENTDYDETNLAENVCGMM